MVTLLHIYASHIVAALRAIRGRDGFAEREARMHDHLKIVGRWLVEHGHLKPVFIQQASELVN